MFGLDWECQARTGNVWFGLDIFGSNWTCWLKPEMFGSNLMFGLDWKCLVWTGNNWFKLKGMLRA